MLVILLAGLTQMGEELWLLSPLLILCFKLHVPEQLWMLQCTGTNALRRGYGSNSWKNSWARETLIIIANVTLRVQGAHAALSKFKWHAFF